MGLNRRYRLMTLRHHECLPGQGHGETGHQTTFLLQVTPLQVENKDVLLSHSSHTHTPEQIATIPKCPTPSCPYREFTMNFINPNFTCVIASTESVSLPNQMIQENCICHGPFAYNSTSLYRSAVLRTTHPDI
jgi:hypothetical protein